MTIHRLGLIGYPLSHSLSPHLHTAALRACGLEGGYSLFPIHSADIEALKNLLTRFRAGELHGLNVTIPYKETVIEFLDELTPAAKAIGAVNTIYLRDNQLIGDNTDSPAFLSELKKFLAEPPPPTLAESPFPILGEGVGVREKSALVLGAGGSARAVIYALLNDGWKVALASRRIEQAQRLAFSFSNYQLQISGFEGIPSLLPNLSLIVNATPLGMAPNVDQSPLLEKLPLPANAFVYDLVYNPRETKLVRNARAQGLKAASGLGMLIEQAALSFDLWTGHTPPREIMQASVLNLQSPIL